MRLFPLLFALLAVALPATAAGEDATVDTRLEQQITVTEPGDRLAAVLERLSKKTGVTLTADAPMSNTVVVVRYTGTLVGFMDALAHFFAVDKEKKALWMPTATGHNLYRIFSCRLRLDELRNERRAAIPRALDQAIRDGHPWMKRFGTLSDNERQIVYAGQPVTRSADFYGGAEFLKELLGEQNAQHWTGDVAVTFFMSGPSPLTRKFSWHLREGNEETGGQELVEGVYVGQICPQLAPDNQQREWHTRYDDPAPKGGPAFVFFRMNCSVPRSEALMDLAEKAKINLIADDAGEELGWHRFANGTLPLSTHLDRVCAFTWGAEGHGSFWRKAGDVYLVRSLAWPEEELGTTGAQE